MTNSFINAAEIEIVPILEQMGAKLIKKTPNEISFSLKEIELSIYFEREFEVYGVISSAKSKQPIYVSEVISDYFNTDEKAVCQISERFPLELCMKKIVGILATKILPLIEDGKIYAAIDTVVLKRKEALHKYNESLIEREAEKAFKEKRYVDVVSYYDQILELDDIQKKRLEISKNIIVKQKQLDR